MSVASVHAKMEAKKLKDELPNNADAKGLRDKRKATENKLDAEAKVENKESKTYPPTQVKAGDRAVAGLASGLAGGLSENSQGKGRTMGNAAIQA